MLEIQELINEASGRQLEILHRLKALNKQAYLHMKGCGRTWKEKYHKMWSLDFWKEGKALLREYFTIQNNGKLICSCCGKKIYKTKGILHHYDLFYNKLNFFTPLYVTFVCGNNCHVNSHNKEHKKK